MASLFENRLMCCPNGFSVIQNQPFRSSILFLMEVDSGLQFVMRELCCKNDNYEHLWEVKCGTDYSRDLHFSFVTQLSFKIFITDNVTNLILHVFTHLAHLLQWVYDKRYNSKTNTPKKCSSDKIYNGQNT